MADKNTGADKITGKTVLGALSDFLIICLMVGGAGFGGYYVGMNQRLAPVRRWVLILRRPCLEAPIPPALISDSCPHNSRRNRRHQPSDR